MTASAWAGPLVTGDVALKGQLTAPHNFNPTFDDGPNVKVYLENFGLTLSANLTVDRLGPNFGNFSSGSGGIIPSGTQVIDYLLHYDFNGGANNDATGTIAFDTPIIGLIVFTSTLNASDGALGIPGVSYYQGANRGLDTDAINFGHGIDDFSVSGNQLTFNIQAWSTSNAIDEVRVILAVPEASTWVAPLLVAGALCWSQRHRVRRFNVR